MCSRESQGERPAFLQMNQNGTMTMVHAQGDENGHDGHESQDILLDLGLVNRTLLQKQREVHGTAPEWIRGTQSHVTA